MRQRAKMPGTCPLAADDIFLVHLVEIIIVFYYIYAGFYSALCVGRRKDVTIRYYVLGYMLLFSHSSQFVSAKYVSACCLRMGISLTAVLYNS